MGHLQWAHTVANIDLQNNNKCPKFDLENEGQQDQGEKRDTRYSTRNDRFHKGDLFSECYREIGVTTTDKIKSKSRLT